MAEKPREVTGFMNLTLMSNLRLPQTGQDKSSLAFDFARELHAICVKFPRNEWRCWQNSLSFRTKTLWHWQCLVTF
jgi:hypothetical protein